jgi:hypothetical protein
MAEAVLSFRSARDLDHFACAATSLITSPMGFSPKSVFRGILAEKPVVGPGG